jgi:hypothetical protein
MGMARVVAAIFAAIYLALGLTGFVVESPLLGFFEVNGLHNLIHVVLGAALLYGATSTELAIVMSRRVGILLFLVGLLGFVSADAFGFMPIGGNDIWLHLSTGAVLVANGIFETADAEAA